MILFTIYCTCIIQQKKTNKWSTALVQHVVIYISQQWTNFLNVWELPIIYNETVGLASLNSATLGTMILTGVYILEPITTHQFLVNISTNSTPCIHGVYANHMIILVLRLYPTHPTGSSPSKDDCCTYQMWRASKLAQLSAFAFFFNKKD